MFGIILPQKADLPQHKKMQFTGLSVCVHCASKQAVFSCQIATFSVNLPFEKCLYATLCSGHAPLVGGHKEHPGHAGGMSLCWQENFGNELKEVTGAREV